MSVHPSLRITGKMKRHRSVLPRLERLKWLQTQGTWDATKSPLGLPKVKNVKVKVKKEKAAAPADAAAAPAGAAPAPAAGAPAKADAAKPKKG